MIHEQHAAPLIALKLRGFATADALAAMLGAPVEAALAVLGADGLTAETRMGLRLTPAGQAAADAIWAAEREALDAAAMAALHADFHAPNAAFKAVVADWQLRDGAPNDHSNAAHDAAVLDRLAATHAAIEPIVARAAALVPRLRRYGDRLAAALARVRAGEGRWVAAPLIDSYHTIWFELHEELIRLSGRTRAAEAAAGRA